jgi:hypothetical protein
MPESVDELAYDLSIRALSQQGHLVDELRSRTGTLLAASSVVASLLGAPALEHGVDALGLLAIAAFIASVIAALDVLRRAALSTSRFPGVS